MRWKLPKEGDIRIKSSFLFFPKIIGYERRWLERIIYKQVYREEDSFHHAGWKIIEYMPVTEEDKLGHTLKAIGE